MGKKQRFILNSSIESVPGHRKRALQKVIGLFGKFEQGISYLLLIILTILLLVQILNRYFLYQSSTWNEEICRISLVWLIYLSIALAAKEGRHIRVGILDLFMPPSFLRIINRIGDFIWISYDVGIVYVGILLIKSTIQFLLPFITNIYYP